MIHRGSQWFKNGFSITELLVVIAVIGILATVSIVVYNGAQGGARDKAVLSDLDTLDGIETQYGLKNSTSGKAWYSGVGTVTPDPDLSFTPSQGNVIDIVINTNDYCIRGYNPNSATYKTLATAAKKESSNGVCSSISPSSLALSDSSGGFVTVSTLAGSSYSYPSIDGTGAGAGFQYMNGAAVGGGNLYVADGGHLIRKVTSGGVVTTFAGSESSGYIDANGTSAKFGYVYGLATDSQGNIYVADFDNNRIRKITPSADVSTFAGSGTSGAVDGTGISAQFSGPSGVTVDSADNVYVTDRNNNRIRKITPAGVVTTLAGSTSGYQDGTGAGAKFSSFAGGIAIGSDNSIYIVDTNNYRIRKVTLTGEVTTIAGSGTAAFLDGISTYAQFSQPEGVAIDTSNRLYITDTYRIRQVQL